MEISSLEQTPKFRGGAFRIQTEKAHECILAGAAETGKTFACVYKIHRRMLDNPRATGAIVRKTSSSLYGTVLRTYARILGPDSPVRIYGGERPQWYDYPNGSRIFVGGMDNPQKVLSSERDAIYVNQAEELTVEDWETLSTRCTGRGGVTPNPQIWGDCNPGPPTHWILHRQNLKLLQSRHEDNPTLFTEDGRITEQGKKTLEILDNLTGIRHGRLRHGKWVSAEGIVYDEWDRDIHLIDRFPIPMHWPRIWSVDFGFTNPFCWAAYALDPDGRLFLYREIYMTHRLVKDHALNILKAVGAWDNDKPNWGLPTAEPRPLAIVCDHDAEGRATLEDVIGISTTPAHKAISEGIQAVQLRLRPAGDRRPRLFILRDSLQERDPELVSKSIPCCTADEVESYIWNTAGGRRNGEEPVDKFNHGMDQLRYAVAYEDLGKTNTAAASSAPPVLLQQIQQGLRLNAPPRTGWYNGLR